MIDSLLILDDQTIWHRRFIEAVAKQMPVVVFRPQISKLPGRIKEIQGTPYKTLSVSVLPGWASKTAPLARPIFSRAIKKQASNLPGRTGVMLMSPAYASLAQSQAKKRPVITYTADDYRSYAGWGGPETVFQSEQRAMRAASLNLFVSKTLRNRSVSEYGLDPERTLVSPNATEERFLQSADGASDRPEAMSDLKKPIIGLLGALSDRLDLDFIADVADLDTVGTLFVAGPMAESAQNHDRISQHPKIKVSGRLPHEVMHDYARSFDAALIPYQETELNWHCSPMRLFDHLASGVPIFGLKTCAQLVDYEGNRLIVSDKGSLLSKISLWASSNHERRPNREPDGLLWSDRALRFKQKYSELGTH